MPIITFKNSTSASVTLKCPSGGSDVVIPKDKESPRTANGEYTVVTTATPIKTLLTIINDGANNLFVTLTPAATPGVFKAESSLPASSKVTVKREDEVCKGQPYTSGADGNYIIETTELPPRRICKLTVTTNAQASVVVDAPTAE
ncbi:hypothetical protein NP233_g13032 [Leucocoprinus birnbaumii]|uniref:Uncharacterized protein n=1 Tax=Leucocoprinus birnbaumii TaxID=56174 RepID=A0AAD5YPD8_9AGAR|nr:hypothetical protein NP233_g13032 [Leucocoprinus birnbaumii]